MLRSIASRLTVALSFNLFGNLERAMLCEGNFDGAVSQVRTVYFSVGRGDGDRVELKVSGHISFNYTRPEYNRRILFTKY